jgi:hypothetical protein
MKYKQTNLMLVDHKNENGNANVQQQVCGTNNHEIINSNLTPTKQNSFYTQSAQFESQDSHERNDQSSFRENNDEDQCEDLFESTKNCSKLNNTENERSLYSTEATTPIDNISMIESQSNDIKNYENFNSESVKNIQHILNVKKRKAQSVNDMPFPKKKLGNESENELKQQKKSIDSKSFNDLKTITPTTPSDVLSKLPKTTDLSNKNNNNHTKESLDFKKKSKNVNLSKVSNKLSHSLSFNLQQKQQHQQQPHLSNQIVKSSDPNSKEKFLNKDKMLINNKNNILKDPKQQQQQQKTQDPNNILKKSDSNFSNVNMKIKPITKDGLKIRISKEPTKLSQSSSNISLLNSSNSVENLKHHFNNNNNNLSNVSLSNASITSTSSSNMFTENHSNSNNSFSKHTSFNESLNDKSVDITLPKYEPTKSKQEQKRTSGTTQLKRSISSAPTTPNYTDNSNNIAPLLTNSIIKNKSITPPSSLELVQSINKPKNLPASILSSKISSNSLKSNFKIPKSKATNQESSESTTTTTNVQRTPQVKNESLKSSQNMLLVNNNISSDTTSLSRVRSQNDEDFKMNGIKEINTILNNSTAIIKTPSNVLPSKQQQQQSINFPSKQVATKETKPYTSSKMRISPNNNNNTSNLSPTYNRPLTPTQSFNRNNRTPLMNTEVTNKNRTTPTSLMSSPLTNNNNFTTNNTTSNFSTYNSSNQILLTPTSPSNNNEEISLPSKLTTTIIPPDSPSNNICETTTIPKLIPLERNHDVSSIANDSLDIFLQVDEGNQIKSNMVPNHYNKCENSPEESSLIIDLVSNANTLLTPLSDHRLDKVSAFVSFNDTRNSPISYSKTNFPDVYDTDDTENDLKVN